MIVLSQEGVYEEGMLGSKSRGRESKCSRGRGLNSFIYKGWESSGSWDICPGK